MRLAGDSRGGRVTPQPWTVALLACALAGVTSAHAQDAEPPRLEAERGEAPPVRGPANGLSDPAAAQPPAYASWTWRRIFSHPRIGSRLTAVAVDPNDPARVVAGSEEGTVFQSFDGGATWEERPLYPFVNIDRSLGLAVPGLPSLGGFIPSTLQIITFPPFSRVVGLPTVPYAGYTPTFGRGFGRDPLEEAPRTIVTGAQGGALSAEGTTFPEFFATFFINPGASQPNLLASVTRSRRGETRPVRTIQFCPGNDFPLLVATSRDLYGSADGGLTYVRLYAIPGRVSLNWVACAEAAPNRVALATSFGLYRSRDGGLTFDLETSGWPGAAVSAVSYGQGDNLFTANGSLLFRGDPDSAEGQVMVYPDYNNNQTAPWRTIRWIEVTDSNQIWLATDDGIRGSLDGGTSWEVPARLMFSRQRIPQVIVGTNEVGSERVAVMLGPGPAGVQGAIWASDDNGESWFPFFQGMTRRSMTQMTAARGAAGDIPRWYVAAGHEIWATVEPGTAPSPQTLFGGDPDSANWARTELQRQPPLDILLDEALAYNRLGPEEVGRFTRGLSAKAWVPRLDVVFSLASADVLTDFDQAPRPLFVNNVEAGLDWEFFIQGTWYLHDAVLANQEFDRFQNQVHEVRRQITFAVEDAWRERTQHLRRIAGGRLNPYQATVLRMRVETLDTVLETWTGRPLSELGSSRGSNQRRNR